MQDQHENSKVPITQLDLSALPAIERFAVWKESISVIFDVALASRQRESPFTSQLTVCHLGSMLLSNVVSHGQFFQRPPKLIAQDGLDHFMVQIYRKGRNAGFCGHTRLDAKPGDVLILDLNQPLQTRTEDFDNLTLVIPRSLLCRYVKSPERFHGRVLPKESPLGRLLNEHLHALWWATPDASPLEANAMAEGFAGLVGAYFGQTTPQEDSPEIQSVTFQTIRQFIARHFANPCLGSDLLMAHFQISRAQLYRFFKPYGGVARYIQDQRLAWCLGELTHPANRQMRSFAIATRAGFTDESHFSRAFRQTYGVSPREARLGAALGTVLILPAESVVDRRYEDWLRQLGGGSVG